MLRADWSHTAERDACHAEIVRLETCWRERPRGGQRQASPNEITVSRWTDQGAERRSLTSVVEPDYHLVSLALRSTEAVFIKNGRALYAGRIRSGALQVCGPGDELRGEFRGPSDTLHLHIPDRLLTEGFRALHAGDHPKPIVIVDPAFEQDCAIEQLGRQLLAADALGRVQGRMFAEGITLALAARLLSDHARPHERPMFNRARGLPIWRLKRAKEYIDLNLGEKLQLSDIAASTGLSRMHFAAQFRAATGMRPHDYVLRRRIERAQDLILQQNASLVDIALSVGFQTQAHFTTVFKHLVGETPSRWRQYQCLSLRSARAGRPQQPADETAHASRPRLSADMPYDSARRPPRAGIPA